MQLGPEHAVDEGLRTIPSLAKETVERAIRSYVISRMVDRDAGFLDDEMQIETPDFCTDLAEWNSMVATETAYLNLRQTRYRIFLVLPPDFHEKPGAGMLVRREVNFDGYYHNKEDAYYGATRKFVMETWKLQEGWTPESPQEDGPTSPLSYADDPVVQGLQGASPPFMPWS